MSDHDEKQISVNVHPSNITERKADSRGRVTLGSQHAESEVIIAILSGGDNE